MSKVLLVEDDLVTCDMVRDWLEHELYTVEAAHTGEEALDLMKLYQYDIVVLDWGLPGKSGVEILSRFRADGGTTPVLILTGKRSVGEKEEGLDAGADDYLTKPFDMRELSARLRALLRRSHSPRASVLAVRNITLDPASCLVTRDGEELKLLPTEYALLEFFMRHPDRVFSTDDILNHVWKSDSEATATAVRTYITRLRKKLDVEEKVSIIKTVHGIGYKLESRED